MKKFLTDNALKILSLVISFVIWAYVVTVVSPDVETTLRGIPITYSGHQSLIENNYMITQQSTSPQSVDLKLKGPRNLIARLSKDNITAYIDFTGYTTEGNYSLPIKVRMPYEEVSVVERNPYNITVAIEKVYSHAFEVEIITKGTPKEGFLLEQPTSTGIKIDVKGPVEIVKTIEKAVVEVDINGAKEDVKASGDVKLLNSNGDIIDATMLTITPQTAEVTVSILKTAVVPITLTQDSEDYNAEITGTTEITIFGKANDVDAVTSIATEPVSAYTESDSNPVQIPLVLPSGIRTEQEQPFVTVNITEK